MTNPQIKPNPPADGSTMSVGVAGSSAPTPRAAGQIEIAAPLEEGSRIGSYEVREHIGDGGMAAVYKVWHTGLHRFEALKIPRYQASRGPEADFLHRLLAEARTAAKLQHPHIVAIHNVSDEKSVLHYFAMEFVDGADLAALLANGPLPFEKALTILRQIGSALDYAHQHGVIHRDIKPANILLETTAEGLRARVVDFGISRAGEEDGSTRLTRSGMIVGTPEYMSPEQSGSGAPVDRRTDIYSLGVVAYEMLCGAPPFVAGDGVSRMSVLMKQINEVPDSLEKFRPDLSPVAAQAVAKALAKNPEERFATCAEFLDTLAAAPPLQEQQAAILASGIKPLRRTMGALFGNPTLAANDKARTLNLGDETAQFAAPLPVQIVRAMTSPILLFCAVIGILLGAFLVWDMKQPLATVPVQPTATPTKSAPLIGKPLIKTLPTATLKPTKKPNPTPTKRVSPPVLFKPTPKKAAVKPIAAKPLQKPKPRPAAKASRNTRKITSSKSPVRKSVMRKSTRRPTKRSTSRRSTSLPIRRSGEAGLPP